MKIDTLIRIHDLLKEDMEYKKDEYDVALHNLNEFKKDPDADLTAASEFVRWLTIADVAYEDAARIYQDFCEEEW